MERYNLPTSNVCVFSWSTGNLNDTAVLQDIGVRTVFQEVPEGEDTEVLEALSDYDVYLLTGDPNMALDEMKEAVLRAQQHYAGLVLDVEPYALDGWSTEGNREAIINSFCDQMEELYAYAQEHSTELILCIPYWYDDLGFDDQLDRIAQASDGMCVMNYSRGNELQNLMAEYRLAGKYYKKLWTAYELTQSDGKGVLENNTYHDQGLWAARENYEENFSNTDIGLAYHDLSAVLEITT